MAHVLGRHPAIAENGKETHLFDRGVNALFDNHEERGDWNSFLREFVSRQELAELVRDLCDGVLLPMRERVKPEARIVLEKTPASSADVAVEMARKLEVYPDARYLHVIRDGRAVAASLMRMPWAGDRSAAGGARTWRRSVEGIRAALAGDDARYRELRYEALLADPEGELRGILEWLGLDATDAYLAEALVDSDVAYAPSDATGQVAPERWRQTLTEDDLAAIQRDAGALLAKLGYITPAEVIPAATATATATASASGALVTEAGPLADTLGARLVAALKARDGDALRALTTDDLRADLRTGAGEATATGDDARWLLLRAFDRVMDGGLEHEAWVHLPGNPGAAFLEARRPGGARIDVSLIVYERDGRAFGVGLLSAGDPGGRGDRPLEV